MFFQRLVVTLIYLIIFTFTTILRPVETQDPTISPLMLILRVFGEAVTLIGAIYKFITELREISEEGISAHFSGSGSMFLENSLSFLYCVSIFLTIFLRHIESPVEILSLAFAAIFGWSYTLFFILGFKHTGPFVVMIYKMLVGDVVRFTMIYVVFLLGFSQGFFILFNERGFGSFGQRLKQSFLTTLGNIEFEESLNSAFPAVSVILIVTYVVVVGIMLLNLLIAMMSETYSRISEEADKQWHLEWARIILAIESEMTQKEREDEKNKYWTIIDGKKFLQVQEVNNQHFLQNPQALTIENFH